MSRRCPRCTFPMEPVNNARVELDQCPRCEGLYFDAGEFARLPQSQDLGPEAYAQHWLGSHLTTPLATAKARCPDGHGTMQAYQLKKDDLEVEVDLCADCGGLWLDKGEARRLTQILQAEQIDREQAESDAGGVKTYLFQLLTGMPLEVYNPTRNKPQLTYLLIAVLFGVFAAELLFGEPFIKTFALIPSEFMQGHQPWSLLSAALLHAGVIHLLGNLYFFYVFGDNIEDRLGARRFAVLMLVSALLGSLAHLLNNLGSEIPELGFSSVVAGVLAAYLVLFPKVKLWVVLFFVRFKISAYWYIGAWIAIQFLAAGVGEGQSGVAYWAHIGGLIGGAALALAWRKVRHGQRAHA